MRRVAPAAKPLRQRVVGGERPPLVRRVVAEGVVEKRVGGAGDLDVADVGAGGGEEGAEEVVEGAAGGAEGVEAVEYGEG